MSTNVRDMRAAVKQALTDEADALHAFLEDHGLFTIAVQPADGLPDVFDLFDGGGARSARDVKSARKFPTLARWYRAGHLYVYEGPVKTRTSTWEDVAESARPFVGESASADDCLDWVLMQWDRLMGMRAVAAGRSPKYLDSVGSSLTPDSVRVDLGIDDVRDVMLSDPETRLRVVADAEDELVRRELESSGQVPDVFRMRKPELKALLGGRWADVARAEMDRRAAKRASKRGAVAA